MVFVRQWWPTAICVALILYATLSPDPVPADDLPAIPHIDKLIHAIMFGGLAGAVAFDMQRSRRDRIMSRRTMAVICLCCAVAGGLDEFAQGFFTDGRSAEFADFIADIAGIAVAFFAAPPAIRRVLGL